MALKDQENPCENIKDLLFQANLNLIMNEVLAVGAICMNEALGFFKFDGFQESLAGACLCHHYKIAKLSCFWVPDRQSCRVTIG
ncbi:hypothetical protein I2I11_21005 [Pontibacter sp. 172403-2]|uniref:hypothetical protein n=1 Tax=Pontibacter rufus TaxID=2791028 RepID=UPI0018AFB88E|nr:hypothetical protein [Pontibacter sp. 172403-2]MBF9255791.1 hypothetical protein [Pontibacter sp. 172403-2]